jgi:hypothetical protein
MQFQLVRPGRVAGLRSSSEALAARCSSYSAGAIAASRAGLIAMGFAIAAVVTGTLRPLPWQLHLVAPLAVGVVGWSLGRRWGDRPVIVLWGLLGLAAGISAAQQLGAPLLELPLATIGTVLGVVMARSPAP